MNGLHVGDPHVRPEDLEDSQRLMDAVVDMANNGTPDGKTVDVVIIEGDLHHTHAITHVDVTAFWIRNLERIKKRKILLVGNHDRGGDRSSQAHALLPYKLLPGVTVVDEPTLIDGILFLPYYFEANEFVAAAQKFPQAKTLVCHQTLTGATYENGFFAKDGVDPALVPQQYVISGHIHTAQEFGKVWYTGSPRWMNVNDANVDKYLWLVEYAPDGSALSNRRQYATDRCCSRLVHLSDSPECPLDFQPVATHRYVVDLKGPQGWIEERRKLYLGRARVRTYKTDTEAPKVKESDGIDVALKKYVQSFKAPNQTDTSILLEMVNERFFKTV